MNNRYDAIVIGAGPGGYPCAIRLGQLNKRVLVVEEEYLGGLCLNWGCIPTKALIYAAGMTDNFKKAGGLGFQITVNGFDIDLLRRWKDGVVKRLRTGVEYLFKANKVNWQKGRARLVSGHRVEVQSDEKTEIFEAENIVIATGTEVIPLPGLKFDNKYIIDTNDALSLKSLPEALLIIGAGASGLEMATIYNRLGSKVTVVEIMAQVLPNMEKELCDGLCKILRKSGIEIFLNSQVLGYEVKGDKVEATIKKPDAEIKGLYDKILVTVGRRPTRYAFKDLAIKLDKRGYVHVDDTLRTNIKNIYGIGDITGPPLLAHKATKQGVLCAEIISGLERRFSPVAIPSCVFTIPPLSSVGYTEKEAEERGYKLKIGHFPYRASGKALSMGETEGIVKIVGDEDGKLLGLHILGCESASLMQYIPIQP